MISRQREPRRRSVPHDRADVGVRTEAVLAVVLLEPTPTPHHEPDEGGQEHEALHAPDRRHRIARPWSGHVHRPMRSIGDEPERFACPGRDSNPHDQRSADFESAAYANSATRAGGRVSVAASAEGLDGLHDEARSGKPRSISDEDVERVIVKTLQEKPSNATHWSTRSMAAATGMPQSAVSRIWRAFGLEPYEFEDFKPEVQRLKRRGRIGDGPALKSRVVIGRVRAGW